MIYVIQKTNNPRTPYIDDYEAEIKNSEGSLMGKRSWSLVRLQDILDDEAAIAENIEDVTDFRYLSAVLTEEFVAGRSAAMTPLAREMEKNGCWNLLVLKCLEILPEYRGHGIGKQADAHLLEAFKGNYGMAVKMAAPLQYQKNVVNADPAWARLMDYKSLKGTLQEDTDLLIHKYESWGFTRIPGTNYLTFNPKDL